MGATVLITRPLAQGKAFANALAGTHGGPVQTVISPLIEVAPVHVALDMSDVAHVVFTSVNGVQQARRLGLPKTATAWCVGAKTADAARLAGFVAHPAGGNSETLVRLIVAAQPQGRMVHIRGRHTAGDLIGGLAAAGIICDPVLAYDQVAVAPTQAAIELLCGIKPVIVPLFSPRSADLFSQIGDFRAPLHLVMISDAITVSDRFVPISSVEVADSQTMVERTLALYKRFSP